MKYGTAGFRDEATKLIEISYDIGRIIAYLTLNSNENYGIMITASHNEYTDNGVKIVGYDGSMIQKKEEEIIENYINKAISIKETYDFISPKKIYIGNDTRESCIKIKEEINRGIISMSFIIKIVDFGIVSTPQHHYLVKYNFENSEKYFYKYKDLNNLNIDFSNLIIDCANGVGYITLNKLKNKLNLKYKLINNKINKYELLNNNSGSDFIITNNQLPTEFDDLSKLGCSIDGDADRFIFYYYSDKLNILDGDYIAALYLKAITKMLNQVNKIITIGYIHSPYTNKAVINWVKTINPSINIKCAATGVKNLHHKALKYDVSVYFESNGHGTLLINNRSLLEFDFFKNFVSLNNEVIGDAVSGIIGVHYCLKYLDINYKDWFNFFIKTDFLLYKKIVTDKNKFETNKIGNRLLRPITIQKELDNINELYNCFCFIRPSGTENIIRIYIESNNNIENIKNNIDLILEKY